VVDDGSRDATGEMAGKAGAIVLRHPVNLGQGVALQTGIDYASHPHLSRLA
jgi:glycosyltransferase involved in cell wall biosynthesis